MCQLHVVKVIQGYLNTSTCPVLCQLSDGTTAVVKLYNNIQGNKALVNEYIAYRIALNLGLPIPQAGIVTLSNIVRAVIYARYSSDKQTEESIEAQVRACREYAFARGYTVQNVYSDEAISGKGSKTASRKQYQIMLRDAAKKSI